LPVTSKIPRAACSAQEQACREESASCWKGGKWRWHDEEEEEEGREEEEEEVE